MNGQIGTSGVVLAVVACVGGLITISVGLWRQSPYLIRAGSRYAWVHLAGIAVAVAAMERALITRDFTVDYVARNGSSTTPRLFNIATLWSALEGSILLWALVLASFVVLVIYRFRRRLDDPLVGWALIVLFSVALFFSMLLIGVANPFGRFDPPVGYDGPGPNPLLQNHPLMAFHPPMLYLGYVGFTVPFAFAISSLVTGRVGEGWLVATRRWTLVAWGFLTAGILLGGWWSYEVLGWGGYWAWDPVENASFLPWLTGTAYLHSVMVQERRGMLRVWNLALVCATFALTILGTFLTRSGVLDSVHSFTESGVGPLILGFFGVIVLTTVGLLAWRGDQLRAPGRIDSALSREAGFMANNLLFAAFALVVLLGTTFPLIVEAVNGDRITVGSPYFETMAAPIGLTLLLLMAIAPVLPWRKASMETLSQRLHWPAWVGALTVVVAVFAFGARGLAPIAAFGLGGFASGSALRQLVLAARRQGWRGLVGRANGGMIVHIGVILVAVAITGSRSYSTERTVELSPGESATIAGHTVTYLEQRTFEEPRRTAVQARVRIDGGDVYAPTMSRYRNYGSPIGTPSVRTGLTEDIYLSLASLPEDPDGPVSLRVIVQPLIVWLWIGGGVMAVGTALAVVPGRRRNPLDPVSASVAATDNVGCVPSIEPKTTATATVP